MRLECDCGFVAHGVSEDDLVVAAQVHARVTHRMHLTAEQILAVAHESPRVDVRPLRGSS